MIKKNGNSQERTEHAGHFIRALQHCRGCYSNQYRKSKDPANPPKSGIKF